MTAYERLSVTVPADIAQQVREAAEQSSESLDAGALVAAERADRRWVVLWDHLVRYLSWTMPLTEAGKSN
ncbi:MAG: hypothetical protein DLM61_23990 [Pseudonocardiales bacterium]|nr:MAG: hypothetical protein DLM61_23990 [Pseudonocardiales bacterium]